MEDSKDIDIGSDELVEDGRRLNFLDRKSIEVYMGILKSGRRPKYSEVAGILKKDYDLDVDGIKVRYVLELDRGADGSNRAREELRRQEEEWFRAQGISIEKLLNVHEDIIDGKKKVDSMQMASLSEQRKLLEGKKCNGVQINQQFIFTQRGGEE